jgi:anti-anti-sigma factor
LLCHFCHRADTQLDFSEVFWATGESVMGVETASANDGNDWIISISGRFDFEMVQEFRAAYTDVQAARYVLDMRATEHMDSSALGMLLNMRKRLGEEAQISIINCRPEIRKILAISRFDRKFVIE